MAIPAAAVTRINAALASLFADLQPRQDAYYNGQRVVRPAYIDANGATVPALTEQRRTYWQGSRTISVDPADGVQVSTDATVRPSYQLESWADLGVALPAKLEIAVWVDQYKAPSGDGWVLHAQGVYGGRTYHRSRGTGPEAAARTTSGWEDVTPAVTP